MTTRLDDAELDSLRGRSWIAQLLYLRALRPYMDYETGIVGGPRRRISYQSLAEELHRDSCQGRHAAESGYPSIQALRSAVTELTRDLSEDGHPRPPLIRRIPADRQLVFQLLLATTDSCVSNKSNRRPTDVQQTKRNRRQASNNLASLDMSNRRPTDQEPSMSNTHPESGYPEKLDPPFPPPESPSPSRFAEFWAAWPAGFKAGRKVCVTKWRAKKLDRIADEIIADVKHRQAQDERWLNGYIPNPATYLNQERWNDDIRKPNSNGGGARKLSAAERAEQSEREYIAEQRKRAAADQRDGADLDPHEPNLRQPLDGEFWRSSEDNGPGDRRDRADRNGDDLGKGTGGSDDGRHPSRYRSDSARRAGPDYAAGVSQGLSAARTQRLDPPLSASGHGEGAAATEAGQGQGRAAPEHDARLAAIWNAGGQRWH